MLPAGERQDARWRKLPAGKRSAQAPPRENEAFRRKFPAEERSGAISPREDEAFGRKFPVGRWLARGKVACLEEDGSRTADVQSPRGRAVGLKLPAGERSGAITPREDERTAVRATAADDDEKAAGSLFPSPCFHAHLRRCANAIMCGCVERIRTTFNAGPPVRAA